MNPELGIHGPAARTHSFGGFAPPTGSRLPIGCLLEKIHPSANHVDLRADAELTFQALDASVIFLANHQEFAHISQSISYDIYGCAQMSRWPEEGAGHYGPASVRRPDFRNGYERIAIRRTPCQLGPDLVGMKFLRAIGSRAICMRPVLPEILLR